MSFVTGRIGAYAVLQGRARMHSDLKCLLFLRARLSDLTDNVHVRGPQDQVSERARCVGQATCTVYVNLAAAVGKAVSYYSIMQ